MRTKKKTPEDSAFWGFRFFEAYDVRLLFGEVNTLKSLPPDRERRPERAAAKRRGQSHLFWYCFADEMKS